MNLKIKQLNETFSYNRTGFVSIKELKEITESMMLIADIARKHAYVPVYRSANSHSIIGYQHHTLENSSGY